MADDVVYVISTGGYESTTFVACPSKVDAERLVARMRAHSDGIYTNIFVSALPIADGNTPLLEVLKIIQILWDDGTPTESTQWVNLIWGFESEAVCAAWRWLRAPCHNGNGGRLEVWGYDHTQVDKLFVEMKDRILTDSVLRKKTEASSND